MTDRPYFPADADEQTAWGENFAAAIQDYTGLLPGVTYPVADAIARAAATLGEADEYLANAKNLAEIRAADREAAAWGLPKKPHKILPNSVFTGPVSARTVDGGLFPLIFTCIDGFIDTPACTDEVRKKLKLRSKKS